MKMKAWVHRETGAPDVLERVEMDRPTPGPGDVLIRNRAIGLNPVDWKFVEWGHADWDWPHIPGVDGAGEVVALGDGVTRLREGTRVAYHNDLLRPGSFAEYTVVPARAVIPLPDALSYEAAATLPCPGLTAWQAKEKVRLAPGSHVLVTGASGAVGGALLQFCRKEGWVVHAVCSSAQAARVRALGAATTLDYRDPNWREQAETLAKEVDIRAVFDMVSGTHATSLAPLLSANGHLVCIQDRQETTPLPAFTTTISLHEVGLNAMHPCASDRLWAELVAAGVAMAEDAARGAFDTQLFEISAFEDLPAALARLKAGPNPGNRVVRV